MSESWNNFGTLYGRSDMMMRSDAKSWPLKLNFRCSLKPDNNSPSQHCSYLTVDMKAGYPFGTFGFKLGETLIWFMYSAFGNSLCTYKMWRKWCPRLSIQVWTGLILFAYTFCRSAFGKSLYTWRRCWKWCQRASIQAWNRIKLN
jgi:hypothetical protein